jgi:serine/threonine protein kinase
VPAALCICPGTSSVPTPPPHPPTRTRTPGTPYYISPEIWNSQPYGKKSDVWSLGILLHELVWLEVPFKAQSLPGAR